MSKSENDWNRRNKDDDLYRDARKDIRERSQKRAQKHIKNALRSKDISFLEDEDDLD